MSGTQASSRQPEEAKEDHLDRAHFQDMADREDWYWWHRVRFTWCFRQLRRHGSMSIADVGCGTGGFLAFLARRAGLSLLGVESSPTARAFLAKRGIQAMDWPLDHTPPLELFRTMDAVSMLDVLEHLDDPVSALRQASLMLKEDGIILLTVPSDPRLFSDWDRRLNHRCRYRRDQLLLVVESAGLEMIGCWHAFRWAWLPALIQRRNVRSDSFPGVGPFLNGFLFLASLVELEILGKIPWGSGTSLFLTARRAAKTQLEQQESHPR